MSQRDEMLVVDFSEVRIGTLRFTDWNNIAESYSSYRSRDIKNKLICFNKTGIINANRYLTYSTTYTSKEPKDVKLFIAPEVKIARDVFRNSGYQIVRDPERSDYTIIPDIPDEFFVFYYDVAVIDNDNNAVTLYTVQRNINNRQLNCGSNLSKEHDWEMILEHFKNRNVSFVHDGFRENAVASFIPRWNCYKDILLDTYPTRQYIEASELNITVPNVINLETLELWERCNDGDVLAKAICTSDWQDYPMTLCLFLKSEKPYINQYGGSNLRYVLEHIGFDKNASVTSMMHNREIQPKDWNLFQKYILHRLKLPDNGGFVSESNYSRADVSQWRNLFRTKACIAPLYIDTPMTYENLCQMTV